MEILSNHNRQELLDYIPYIKPTVKEWMFIDVRLTDAATPDFSILSAAKMLHALFYDKEGKIYVCNEREILMLIRWKKPGDNENLSRTVKKGLPEESCEITVQEGGADGLIKIALLIGHQKPAIPSLVDVRKGRRENIILVADDDMYMRMLVKKGVPANTTVHEVANGNEVVEAFKKYVPDIVFLDIHLPGREGRQILHDLLKIDPNAYVIMLSADSSPENVEMTTRQGAKDFLTKPFTKERLLECFNKCSTLA